MDLVERLWCIDYVSPRNLMSHLATLIAGSRHHSVTMEMEFEPCSEFKIWFFSIALAASQLIELPGRMEWSSNKQLCSIHLVLFLSWHPTQPLVKCQSLT